MFWIAVAVLRFTMPTMQVDTMLGCESQSVRPSSVAAVRLYRVKCYQAWNREFIRQKPETAGRQDTLRVDDSVCATYFLTAVDSGGRESCERGITVGIPPTGVGTEPRASEVLYDVQGRRARLPLRSGWYCSRNGKWVRIR